MPSEEQFAASAETALKAAGYAVLRSSSAVGGSAWIFEARRTSLDGKLTVVVNVTCFEQEGVVTMLRAPDLRSGSKTFTSAEQLTASLEDLWHSM